MGWVIKIDGVITADNAHEKIEKNRNGSLVAEFRACAFGLNSIKSKESHVELVTDNTTVFQFLSLASGQQVAFLNKLEESRLKDAIEGLHQAIKPFTKISYRLESPKKVIEQDLKDMLDLAHNYASLASGAGELKRAYALRALMPSVPLLSAGLCRSTDGALDIIDPKDGRPSDLNNGPMPIIF